MRHKTWQRKLYDFFIEHWMLSALIMTAPTYWFTFVKLFGKNLGFITDTGELNESIYSVLWPLFILSFLFTFIKTGADRYNEKVKENGQFVLYKILDSVNNIKYKKYRRFKKYISEHHDTIEECPFYAITQPQAQIDGILEVLQNCLSDIFGINQEHISLNIIYRTDKNGDWQWLQTRNLSHGLPLKKLVSESKTSVMPIIEGKKEIVFYPDKRIAIEKGEYVPGRIDIAHENRGSILCKDVSIEDGNRYVQAILSISTHGIQICDNNDHDAIYKINSILLPAFEKRIRLELSLLYIKDVMSP